ncbi:MAG: hypothetical protein KIS92_25880 [Planctomycetota bacterium]|nr:hypothetical protein [Planctomycetota bacterium]
MDAVKRYVFWIVLAVVLVIAAGGYLLVVPSLGEQADGLRANNETKRAKVAQLAKDHKSIQNNAYVVAANNYQRQLEAEKNQILDSLKDKKLVLGERFKKAPSDIQIQFDQWLKDTRQEILDKAAKNNLRLPADFATQQMFEGRKTEDENDRLFRIERLALIDELVRILSETKGDVSQTSFEPDLTKPDSTERALQGVMSLDKIEILGEKDYAARTSAYARKAWDLGKAASLYKDPSGPSPVKTAGLELRFTAPFSVVAPVLQALENTNVFYGVIRKIDTQRASCAYPGVEDLAGLGVPKKDGNSAKVHPYFQEPPLQVLVLLELNSFDAEGAKAAFAPPAAPPAKK